MRQRPFKLLLCTFVAALAARDAERLGLEWIHGEALERMRGTRGHADPMVHGSGGYGTHSGLRERQSMFAAQAGTLARVRVRRKPAPYFCSLSAETRVSRRRKGAPNRTEHEMRRAQRKKRRSEGPGRRPQPPSADCS